MQNFDANEDPRILAYIVKVQIYILYIDIIR
jgi:hypothetical protein